MYSFDVEPAVCEIFDGTIKKICGMIEFFMGHLSLRYRVYERLMPRSERDEWREGSWEGRSWHRLFTQAASWCMARCWMLSVPFIRPPLAETRDNLASDQRPLRCSLKAPCYMIKRGVGMNLRPFMAAWRRASSLKLPTGADGYMAHKVLFETPSYRSYKESISL